MTTSNFLDDDDQMEPREESLLIPADGTLLEADLVLPADSSALVVFAHGSGSSRNSPRNRFVAGVLNERGLGTLLFDLLTSSETCLDAIDLRLRFDIELLAGRLCAVMNWLRGYRPTARLCYGCFGASTGAAAALTAAARMPKVIEAVVSRGGRPDLAQSALPQVSAPTLLIVGGEDSTVLELNREAFSLLSGEKRLEIVEGATHLFEEPGTL
ncbi:MAG TPA: alpha/beta hydrolase, partial [Polyangiaceae bacterium]|nr:alpha/beta hydrolase [Polyangiaceae bacterium]